VVGGGVLAVIGVTLILAAGAIGEALNAMRAESVKRSSFLSGPTIDRLQQVYRSPENQVLERRIVRAVGFFVTLAGAALLIQALLR
jgi:hypothetical protein